MYTKNIIFVTLLVIFFDSAYFSNVTLKPTTKWTVKQLFPSYKIPEEALRPDLAIVRRKIVLYHNFFRNKTRPSASNMLLMSWHKEAALQAQKYAEECRFLQHNRPDERFVASFGASGQNLFASSQKTTWFFAIKSWFLEYNNFTYGAPVENLNNIGHYTQMVWATSHKVGCGIAYCKGGPWGYFYNYVCHYAPGGNIYNITQYPYKIGKPCQDCPNNCLSGLCTNSCPFKDVYNNCNAFVKTTDVCQKGYCNATCVCGNSRLHKNFPWK